jgi:hypothetical protein
MVAAMGEAGEAEAAADWNGRACEDNQRLIAAAERSRDELGIQLAACQERLRLAMACAEHLRDAIEDNDVISRAAQDALDALDAVPGDALSRDIGPALDRAHEASGVVTQKGGEK